MEAIVHEGGVFGLDRKPKGMGAPEIPVSEGDGFPKILVSFGQEVFGLLQKPGGKVDSGSGGNGPRRAADRPAL